MACVIKAKMSDLESRYCLAWTPTKPGSNEERVSAPFLFLRCGWHLSMRYSKKSDEKFYEIYLQQDEEKFAHSDHIKRYFRITTFIRSKRSDTLCYTAEVLNTIQLIWKFDEKQVSHSMSELTKEDARWKIVCMFHSIDWYLPVMEFKGISIPEQKDLDLETLSDNFRNLLEEGKEFSDVELKCGDRTFSAHKAVLAARSKVFRSKFTDSETSVVEVTDMKVEDLEVLLKYMYSGKLSKVPRVTTVWELYKASNKYDVHSIRKACTDSIVNHLSPDVCIAFLITAEGYGDVYFKNVLISYICDHRKIFETEKWSTFARDFPKLAKDVYQRFVRCNARQAFIITSR